MRKLWIGASVGVMGAAAYGLLWRLPRVTAPPPQPAASPAEALARLQKLQAQDGPEINPLCRTQLLAQPAPARRVVMLYHGYTNCPHQYHQLAARLHAAGDMVLMPRLPLHGATNRVPRDLHRLTAQRVVDFVQATVDIAAGLAPELAVLGFSFGGVLAAWAAQHRPEVQRAVLVSPAFDLQPVPNRRLYAALLPRLPDQFVWWDPALKEEAAGPSHAYLGFSRRGVGHLLRLGLAVEQAARRRAPAAGSICLIVNPSDELLDNRAALALAARWKRHRAKVEVRRFAAEDQLMHDLMDPLQPLQQVDKVYPLVEQALATAGG